MLAMTLAAPRAPLRAERRTSREPGPGEVRLKVRACGVCRTDLHVVDGELPMRRADIVPGHEIVGVVGYAARLEKSRRSGRASDLGPAWLAETCGHCAYCLAEAENLCDQPSFNELDPRRRFRRRR